MDIDVRLLRHEDIDVVVDLMLAQMHEHDIVVSREHVERKLRSPEPLVIVAQVSGAIVGIAYVSFAEPMEHAGTIAWLEELYVAPEHRERGVGGRLVDEVCRRADERGCLGVELETKRGHERAGHLYVRSGFRDLGRKHYAKPLRAWDWPHKP
jgi:GNAT superfamily N-acetyltransferase